MTLMYIMYHNVFCVIEIRIDKNHKQTLLYILFTFFI